MVKVTAEGLVLDGIAWPDILSAATPPFFVLFPRRIMANCDTFAAALKASLPRSEIFYSAKANYLPETLEVIAERGAGVQVVSPAEFVLARSSGFTPDRIIVDGTYHDDAVAGIVASDPALTVVESWLSGIDRMQEACGKAGSTARLGLRFAAPRPDHRLGFFGEQELVLDALANTVQRSDRLALDMLACHGGSQIHDDAAHAAICAYLLAILDGLEARGVQIDHPRINLGGGFAEPEIASPARLERIMGTIRDTITETHDLDTLTVCFEPGRYLVADAAVLVATIDQVFVDRAGENWATLDIGLDVITRFANSHYRLFSAEHTGEPHGTPTSFQGRIPAEIDVIGRGMPFATELVPGEHVLVMNCGAYSTTFSQRFSFTYPCYLVVKGGSVSFSRANEAPF